MVAGPSGPATGASGGRTRAFGTYEVLMLTFRVSPDAALVALCHSRKRSVPTSSLVMGGRSPVRRSGRQRENMWRPSKMNRETTRCVELAAPTLEQNDIPPSTIELTQSFPAPDDPKAARFVKRKADRVFREDARLHGPVPYDL